MKKRNFIAISTLFILIALCCHCTRGQWDAQDDPPCSLWIEDDEIDGPYHMIMGIGMGGVAALDIALDNPELFGASAALSSPLDLQILLADIETKLTKFDDWSSTPTREDYLQFLSDIFIALGNPAYINPSSKYYPPGVSANESVTVVANFISPDNADGSLNAITFSDVSGYVVDFLLALDQNSNGIRDSGEPILLRMHEPFTDDNSNGIHDEGEAFEDYGLDGVDGTNDYGEGNGDYDLNPQIETWLRHSPAAMAGNGEINTDSRFKGAIYMDCGRADYWNCSLHDGFHDR